MLAENEELNSELSAIRHGERDQEQLFKSKQSKLFSDMEDLKSQLERVKEREKLKVFCLEKEKVNYTKLFKKTKLSFIFTFCRTF